MTRRSPVSTLAVCLVAVSLASLLPSVRAGFHASSLSIVIGMMRSIWPTSFSGLHMLEFGNQLIHDCCGLLSADVTTYVPGDYALFDKYQYFPRDNSARRFFEHLGFHHTSVDYNGADGALQLDARADLRGVLGSDVKYDVLTNIGFSEHVGENEPESGLVESQYLVFRTFHYASQVGTLLYNELPAPNNWRFHGVVGYETTFFDSLALANDYEILALQYSDHLFPSMGDKSREVIAVYRKRFDRDFMSLEEFRRLPGLISKFRERNHVWLELKRGNAEVAAFFSRDLSVPGAIEEEAKSVCTKFAIEAEVGGCILSSKAFLAQKLVELQNIEGQTKADP